MRSFCVSLFLICLFFNAKATHIVGGDLSYQCIGNDQYIVTVKIYRDCYFGQAEFDNPIRVTVFNGVNGDNQYDILFLTLDEVNNIPFNSNNPCLSPPPNVCVEEGIYEQVITLPYDPNGYHLATQRCCRNNTINNIYNPSTTGVTYTIYISDLAQSTCNASPVFNDFPPLIICGNEELLFDHSASDAEGDQVVYSFCSPLIGGSLSDPVPFAATPPPFTPVTFISPPYAPTNPLNGSPQVTIDANTGLITGTPNTFGQFVVGVCVEEYRNGALLSVTKRDFQFNVVQCLPPIVTATPSVPDCPSGAQGSIELNITGGTPDYQHSWNNGTTGADGTGTSINNLWGGTYDITITDDLGCIATTSTIVEDINPIDINVLVDSLDCGIGFIDFLAQGLNGTPPYTYQWTGLGSNPAQTIFFGNNASYYVSATDAEGCTAGTFVSAAPYGADPDGDGKPNACDTCPDLDNLLIGTPCDDGDSLTTNDVYRLDCICAGIPSCVSIDIKVLLEGAYNPLAGEMKTSLNSRGLLPGQTPTNPYATPYPAGQPYDRIPWDYLGAEGLGWTSSNYTPEVVDWVLVSFRTGTAKNTETAIGAGLLLKDGKVAFTEQCILPYKQGADSAYVVIEHRNHLGIMSPEPVYIQDYTLVYDFKYADSYRDPTSFGQKQLPSGEWVMYAGDGDQTQDFPSFDISGLDKNKWQEENGTFDFYIESDYNFDGEVNGGDKVLWMLNNGVSSRVPR